jgi:hypothetical protein
VQVKNKPSGVIKMSVAVVSSISLRPNTNSFAAAFSIWCVALFVNDACNAFDEYENFSAKAALQESSCQQGDGSYNTSCAHTNDGPQQ